MPDQITALLRKHRAALTRAKKLSPSAALAACERAFVDFEIYGYPDQWSEFERARIDAENAIFMARRPSL